MIRGCFLSAYVASVIVWIPAPIDAASLIRTSNVDGNPAVEMITGNLKVHFDTRFGGNPRHWYLRRNGSWSSASIIDPHPGRSMNAVYETGQDATQSSSNGVDPNPIHVSVDPATAKYSYYMRETLFDAASCQYEVTGFTPFFWISHEPIDDAIPPNPDGTIQNGWFTWYQESGVSGCEVVSDCFGRSFVEAGVPVWFDADSAHRSGILLIGDEKRDTTRYEWNERLCETQEGRVAFKVTVSLSDASLNSQAAVMFRRSVPSGLGATIDDAYQSAGYSLSVNRSGVVQILRSNGSGDVHIDWNQEGTVHAPTVASPAGAELELRTHNAYPDSMWIYVNDALVGTYHDGNPFLGPHCGLFADCDPGTSVKFSHRQFFDVGIEMAVRYAADLGSWIDAEIEVRNADFVTNPHTFYSHHTQVAFFNIVGYTEADLELVDATDECQQFRDDLLYWGACGQPCSMWMDCPPNPAHEGALGSIITPILRQTTGTDVHWLGDIARVHGLYFIPLVAEIDGKPAPAPWSMVQYEDPPWTPPGDRLMTVQNAPFEYRGQDPIDYPELCAPFEATSFRVRNRWALTVPPYDLTTLHVQDVDTGCETGTPRHPFRTVTAGFNVSDSGDVLRIAFGQYHEALTFDRPVRLESQGGLVHIGP